MRRRFGLLLAAVATLSLVGTACDVADPGSTDTLPPDYVMPDPPSPGPLGDVAYGAHPRQKLDLYLPPDSGTKRPLIVYVHGGGFGGSKVAERSLAIQSFAEPDAKTSEGYVVASVEYRQPSRYPAAPGVTLRDMVIDVRMAIRFLKEHAGEYGIDPNRVVVAGESAGGYLALMAAVAGPSWEPPGTTTDVRGFVDIVGPYDVEGFAKENHATNIFALLFPWLSGCTELNAQHAIADDDPCWSEGVGNGVPSVHDASPMTHLDPADPGGYAVCGTEDGDSPCKYIAPLGNNGVVPVLLDKVDGAGHQTDRGINLTALASFLDNATAVATTP